MRRARAHNPGEAAFTLVEVLVVVVILAILAAVAVPRVAGASAASRTQATRHALQRARVAIADYRARAAIDGLDPFPTADQLRTEGEILTPLLPANPFTGVAGLRSVTIEQAEARTVTEPTSAGWAYGVDNADGSARAVIYANTSTQTTDTDPVTGNTLTANQL